MFNVTFDRYTDGKYRMVFESDTEQITVNQRRGSSYMYRKYQIENNQYEEVPVSAVEAQFLRECMDHYRRTEKRKVTDPEYQKLLIRGEG